jgi:hypothetical protein
MRTLGAARRARAVMHNPTELTEAFEREHGCTVPEWLRWLPGAVGAHALECDTPGAARVPIGAGCLHLQWQELSPRRIALLRMPRLRVTYRFESVPEADRSVFMRHFDLFIQRGGG